VNGGDDDQFVFLGDVLDEGDDFERGGGVETGRGLVEEEKLGARDLLFV
jgi:hypothetical protein